MLNFSSVIASGLMMWKGLGLVTNTESPIVVVLRYVQIRLSCHSFSSQIAPCERQCIVLILCIFGSGSMEPAFYRGDLLFLTNPAHERYHTGDITVYKISGANIPIVHRILETHDKLAASVESKLDEGSGYVD